MFSGMNLNHQIAYVLQTMLNFLVKLTVPLVLRSDHVLHLEMLMANETSLLLILEIPKHEGLGLACVLAAYQD